ncbi:dickkopf-related protein 4-like [Anabas testudineus]|uniref:dickkopf-related protein 4-like n=1 Tax=Anabas testudineus TaxID=64144 RepID=UPI000E4628AF|nr:dickkopf-related protein 4-like [Anabas testudineus]
MMWVWRSVLCVSLVCGLALDSNTIRSSKETQQQSSEQLDRSNGDRVEQATRRRTETNSNRRSGCTTPGCDAPTSGSCSNRAQRRPSAPDRQVDRNKDSDGQSNIDTFNRTKAPEMSTCVRTRDCEEGLCCTRYLNSKRCLRIPVEGEACLLRGATKRKSNLGRCSCDRGLSCTAASQTESGKNKGQGVCRPSPQQAQRKTRHSGKKRRTAERSC